ncbi:MAG TPA: pH regulation protein F [Clostridia bacterium]|nr:pH regulation protein F [Clostridia bacterium]
MEAIWQIALLSSSVNKILTIHGKQRRGSSIVTIDNIFFALLVGLVVLIIMMLFRVFKGPTVFDRLNGLGVIGTDAIIILVIIGFLSGREEMFLDIAISYSILGFIASVVIAKYLGGKGESKE